MSQDDQFSVRDESSERTHFHIMPNVIEHMGLDVWEYRLYGALKSTAGERGACFKSNSTLCKQIGVSLPKMIEAKKSLQEKGLITIKKQAHPTGGSMPDLITIVDVWGKNAEFVMGFYTKKNGGGSKQDLGGGVNGVEGGSKQRLDKQESKEQKQIDDDVRARESERENEKMQTSDDVKSPTAEPVRQPGKKYSIHLIDGGIMQISADDVYTVAVQRNKDWTGEEIENALVSIENSCKKVRDWVRYLEGVIETSRLQNKTSTKRNYGCKQKTQGRQTNNSTKESLKHKENSSAPDTRELVSAGVLFKSRIFPNSGNTWKRVETF